MHIEVVTLFPEMFSAVSDNGVTGRAIQKGLVQLGMKNPRDYTHDRHNTVDARPYGGGPGMVMMVEPLRDAIRAAKSVLSDSAKVVYLSPQGRKLDQAGLLGLAQDKELVLLCGRYEGIDERLIASEVDEEWSIGDYVISGGELAAMVLIDGVTRLIPGALGHEDSAEQDSFMNGLLDTPHYTRPEVLDGQSNMAVPDVLLSGNHKNIEQWRLKQALGRTWLRRPELLEKLTLNQAEQDLLAEFIRETELDNSTIT